MFGSGMQVFLATAPVDFRTSFDRLAGTVREQLRGDPRSGAFFVFVNKARDRCKVLFFDRTGYCLLHKRLDTGTFRQVEGAAPGVTRIELSPERFAIFLEGVADERVRRTRRPRWVRLLSDGANRSEIDHLTLLRRGLGGGSGSGILASS
jgi:transposase